MLVTITETTFRKLKPKIINYRKYKFFSNDIFRDTLLEELSQIRINNDDDKICKTKKLYVSLLRKTKRSYYLNLNKKNVIDNRKFWKTVKPLLSNKFVNTEAATGGVLRKKVF